jgi:hypothetical protein
MEYKEGYFNYRSKIVDKKLQLVRKRINQNGDFVLESPMDVGDSKYEYETQPFFFLSEGERFYFYVSVNPSLFYVVSKENIHLSEDLVYSNKENQIKGEIMDDFLSSKFDDDEVMQSAIERHLTGTYKSYLLFRSFADRQFGNTVCFEEVYGIHKNNDKIYNDKMIDELFYLCKDNKYNRWIEREERLKKILKK